MTASLENLKKLHNLSFLKNLSFLLFIFSFSASAENVVKTMVINPDGFSAMSADLTTAYAGMAGSAVPPCTGDTTKTCNSCTDRVGSVEACNQSSIYPSLKVKVIFQVSKALTSAVAGLYVDNATGALTALPATTTVTSAGDGLPGNVYSLETTWTDICAATGHVGCTGLVSESKRFGVGVDGNASGAVDSDEIKVITVKMHFIPPASSERSQAYCASQSDVSARSGICNLSFLPGDQKVYIDQAVWAGESATSGLSWDGIVLFPIPVANSAPATEAGAFTGFKNGLVAPVIRPLSVGSNGAIPNSAVESSFQNYQRYCFVYATKNQAQNIYRFVTTGVVKGCETPAEVVGLLNDKHCFISTAAFGSEMAEEVFLFRQFRNEYLLTNSAGRKFVRFYYHYSPPVAQWISENETLRTLTRGFLYPLLGFSYISVHYGLLAAFFTVSIFLILFAQISKALFRNKKFFLIILLFSFNLHASTEPEFQKVMHPGTTEGLVKIKKDGSYVYDVKYGLKNQSSHLQFGQASHPDVSTTIETTDSAGNVTGTNKLSFDSFYPNASQFIISYDYEYFPWINKGMLGFQFGTSLMYADGHGVSKATNNSGLQTPSSVEKFSFLTLPIDLGIIYRLQWKTDQNWVPYASGGATYVFLAEKREDKPTIYYTGDFGFYGSGGMLLNLNAFSTESAFELNSEYGIGNLWFSLEYKLTTVNSAAFSFVNRTVNAGLSFDF